MRIRIGRVAIALLALALILYFITNLFKKTPEQEIINAVLEDGLIQSFAETHDEEYNVTYLSKEELAELKQSPQYAFYVDLPDKPVYRILVLEERAGYLIFVDAETQETLTIMEADNLRIT
jgi:hypothetical protein